MLFTQDKLIVRKHSRTPGPPLDQNKLELAKLLNDAKSMALMASNAGRSDLKETWFGQNLPAGRSAEIDAGFNKIYKFLDGLQKFTFTSASNDPNSIASFPQKTEHKVAGGMPLSLLQMKYRNSAFLYIGPKFTTVDYKEKVTTFMHELTHMTLGTEDVKVEGKEMYGEQSCIELAEKHPELAFRNAENWALYAMSYWNLWKH